MSAINTYFATAAKGLETLLAEELVAMGMTEVKEARAGVYFPVGLKMPIAPAYGHGSPIEYSCRWGVIRQQHRKHSMMA